MDIAISSASLYPQLLTESALVNIAALGCKSVEIFLQTRSEYKAAYIKKLRCLCSWLNLSVHSVHGASAQYEPLLFYKYSRQKKDGWEILREIHQAAALLGAKHHVFHGPLKTGNLEFSQLSDGLNRIATAAANWGLKLALENVSWCAGWSPTVFERLNGAGINNLYYTFDSKQAWRSGFPFKEFLKVMGPRLVNVHLSAGNGALPTEHTDFTQLASVLATLGYRGPVVLEVYGREVKSVGELATSWRILRGVFN